jgi:hypothetical protein
MIKTKGNPGEIRASLTGLKPDAGQVSLSTKRRLDKSSRRKT